ncbi:MAG TPA: phospho-N-acetylmuramoyl-pentapeptide-transferase [Streptosporangiaceae bacterium]|nr:phospho-N-acetylmuramoyl-pentapeptide-transferase [Streptosporangiaceae bacterium]
MKTILVAGGLSLLLALFGTPLAIRVFSRRGYGQLIREEGPAGHATKRGTPTMGGTVIVVASLAGYFAGNVATGQVPSISGLLVMMLMTGLGVVGFIDDFIKIYKQRSLGLRSSAKLAGQAVVGAVFAALVVLPRFADGFDITPADAHLSFLRDFGPALGLAPFVLWIVILIAGTSNAVNLTDGLDGLATGSACLVLAAYVLIGNWQLRNDCTAFLAPRCYPVRDPLDLAVVAAAVLGACFGFLWWNAPPARIFMGDTGSLALGGVLAGLAVCTKTQLLLAILGGLYVVIALSVIIQVGSFKLTGRRVFRMAPLQHHFELLGWAETTIVIRFWLICGLFVALGLGIFYVEWMPK